MENKVRLHLLANSLTLVGMLIANYFASAGGGQNTVSAISHKYDSLFAPAGYAFSIWGLIFILCIGFVGHQWYAYSKKESTLIVQTGPWFWLSNMANALWLYCWTSEQLGLSVLVIIFMLFCLCKLVVNLRLELDDEPVKNILFVWWPISIYLGWIMVATIACIAAWLVKITWNAFGFAPDVWTQTMVTVATLLYLYLVLTRNLRETAVVGIWAFVAIAVRQWQLHINIGVTALVAAATILLVISWHGYKNRMYNPLAKLMRGEWSRNRNV